MQEAAWTPLSGHGEPRPAGALSAALSPQATQTLSTRGRMAAGQAAHVVPAGGARPLQSAPAVPGEAVGLGATEEAAPHLPPGQACLCVSEKGPTGQLGHRHGWRPSDAGHALGAEHRCPVYPRCPEGTTGGRGAEAKGSHCESSQQTPAQAPGRAGKSPGEVMAPRPACRAGESRQGGGQGGESLRQEGASRAGSSRETAQSWHTRIGPGLALGPHCASPLEGNPETQHPPRRSPWGHGEAVDRENHSINNVSLEEYRDEEAERRTSLQTGLPSKTCKVGSAALCSAANSFTPTTPSHPHAPALR